MAQQKRMPEDSSERHSLNSYDGDFVRYSLRYWFCFHSPLCIYLLHNVYLLFQSACLSACPSACMSVYMSACLPACPSVFMSAYMYMLSLSRPSLSRPFSPITC